MFTKRKIILVKELSFVWKCLSLLYFKAYNCCCSRYKLHSIWLQYNSIFLSLKLDVTNTWLLTLSRSVHFNGKLKYHNCKQHNYTRESTCATLLLPLTNSSVAWQCFWPSTKAVMGRVMQDSWVHLQCYRHNSKLWHYFKMLWMSRIFFI